MGVSTSIQIIAVDKQNQSVNKFTTTVMCDQLAYMLFDWNGNCFINSTSILNDDEIKVIKATFGEESITVLDGLGKFEPNFVLINQLKPVFEKIRNEILLPNLKEQITKGDNYEITKLNRDIIGISECIGALEVFKHSEEKVYITLEDC
jgi:hypothetical protein